MPAVHLRPSRASRACSVQAPFIQFLGTGTAFHADGRGSQSILLQPASGGPFLVDLGPTAVSAMMRFGVDYASVDSLFLTHLHGDHTAGWPFLLLNLNFLAGRTRPVSVYGPEGMRACLEGLTHHCYGGLLSADRLGFAVNYHELPLLRAAGLGEGERRFDTVPMDHHQTSIGYRFEVGGKRIAVSGDTRWCEALEELAGGSDLLVVECTSVDPQDLAHVSLREIRAGIGRLGGCELLLVHLTDDVAADLAADPLVRVTATYDGMTVPL